MASEKYSHLRVVQKYDRFDFWNAFKAFLPRGEIWRIPMPNEQDIAPYGIQSAEAFGRVVISQGDAIIAPDGIASAEAFGVPSLQLNPIVVPVGIATGEAFGSPNVSNIPFHLRDDFDGGVHADWWNSSFKTNWPIQYDSSTQVYYAQRATGGTDDLTPAGVQLVGDFFIEVGVYLVETPIGNQSVHLFIDDYGGGNQIDLRYFQGVLYFDGGAEQPLSFSIYPSVAKVRLERIGSVTRAYYFNTVSQTWIRDDAWDTPGTGKTGWSGNWDARIDGSDANNGVAYIDLTSENLA